MRTYKLRWPARVQGMLLLAEKRELRRRGRPLIPIPYFEDLTSLAESYHLETGLHLSVYGDIGELFGAITYGIKLNRTYAQGSDGRLGNDHVEIKTITPFKVSVAFGPLLISAPWPHQGCIMALRAIGVIRFVMVFRVLSRWRRV